MQPTAPTQSTTSWVRPIISVAAVLATLWMFGLVQVGSAQTASQPLSLFKNYFVTGDYVIGGVGLRGLGVNGYATGTIPIPDPKQPNSTSVPAGADVVAAFLYWQTVESSQSAFAGQNGFFNNYPIEGKALGNPNAPVSWSSGGCSGSSQGSKTIRTYRADVRPFLRLDSSGNIQANGAYTVSLADSGSNGGGAPLTLGATLVIIYRVLSPAVPLNSIVLYDGSYAPSNPSGTFLEPIEGFYDAAVSPAAKITEIVGNGQPNKGETVYLNSVTLPSLYGTLPPFPGIYQGSWDNPTWFPNNTAGAVNSTDSSATNTILPTSSNQGCVSWGAVIFSTTVQDSDHDGLLDVWKANQGYADVNTGDWVALPGAKQGEQDIFIQGDYLDALNTNTTPPTGHSHLPKEAAIDAIGNAFKQHNIHVHFDLGPVYQNDPYVITYPLPVGPNATPPPTGTGGHAIPESSIVCTDSATSLCEYPGQPVVSWKAGFAHIKSQNFWEGRKDSYHYVLFGHAIGMPAMTWSATGVNVPSTAQGTLVSIVNSGNVGTVTIKTPVEKPPLQVPTASSRVTITGAIGQFALNGTYLANSILKQSTANNVITTVFTITTSGVADGTYNYSNEAQLAVLFGGPESTSGFSDEGGGDSLITLGLWRADDPSGCQPDPSQPLAAGQTYCSDQVGSAGVQARTLMHELGHTLGLTHGGTYYAGGSSVATYGMNCKPNYLSVMSYLFQIRGFPDGGVDYSGQTLPPLDETNLSESVGIGTDSAGDPVPHLTRWYAPPNALDTMLQNTVGGRFATTHCDGTPITNGGQAVRVDGTTYSSPIDWNNNGTIDAGTLSQDVNFNGIIGDAPFQGYDDWANLNLEQIGARPSIGGYSGDVGGADIFGGGADIFGGGADIFGGGADIFGGGADIFGGGADIFGGGAELDFVTANATVDPPVGLTCTNCGMKAKTVSLVWNPPSFGQIRAYHVWRAVGSFTTLASLVANSSSFSDVSGPITGTPPLGAFADSGVKNNTTYTYFVTDVNAFGVQSGPSSPVVVTVSF